MNRTYGILHTAYLALLGLAGWGVLIYLTLNVETRFLAPRFDWEVAATFFLMGVARLMAFRIFRRIRIAIDSTFYIAALFIFGTITAAWMLALAMTIDGVMRFYRGTSLTPKGEAPVRHVLATVLHSGGFPGLVLIGVSAFFGDRQLSAMEDADLMVRLPLFTAAFLVAHYALVGGAGWFAREVSPSKFRTFFPRVFGAEATLVPLSFAMVLAYKHQGPLLYFVLAATGLLFSLFFRRAVIMSERLRDRVDELSAINRIARVVAGAGDRNTLLTKLSTATLQLVGRGSLFMVGVLADDRENVNYELFDASGQCTKQLVANRRDGLSGWVMDNNQGLVLNDIQTEYSHYARSDRYNDDRYHSWLGVPLVVYGEVIGVMTVQSTQPNAYNVAQLRVLATIGDQVSAAIENSRLYQLATIDGLTGLFVRRYFDQRVNEEWHRTARYGNPFTLGLIDLDRFKRLNDTYGHQVGDEVLRAVGKVIKANMRSFDLAARYGGEELVFILPRTTIDEALVVTERIRRDIANLRIPIDQGTVAVTASIGLATAPSDALDSPESLVAAADEALYRAKEAGRNRVLIGHKSKQPATEAES